MKGWAILNKLIPLMLGTILYLHPAAWGQDSKNKEKDQKSIEMQALIQSKKFVFVAQNATPLGGRNINLTSVYDVKLLGDTLVSELPYYGRAFVAPMNPTEGPLSFTSTKFSYQVNPRKKGGWDITITPEDNREVRQLFFTVSEKGYTSLQVTNNNRQPINFSGYITSKEKFR
jgi:hypothetical protein